MTCMCGAYDCPDCGPAQGCEVRRRWHPVFGWQYYNPEPEEDDQPELDDEPTDEDEESDHAQCR